LLIVWHSATGGTRQMAEAAEAGAQSQLQPGDATALRVRRLTAREAEPADVLEADGLVFATPECLGSMAGLMKDFFDRCYYPVLEAAAPGVAGRPYASLICAGSDGQGAARQLARIATGWRLRAVTEPILVCTHAQTPAAIAAAKQIGVADRQRCHDLGAALAAGLQLGVY
jgi:multimeric flavodoxin WrbA